MNPTPTRSGFILSILHFSNLMLAINLLFLKQRLEFLGDSVLDFLITRHLFNTYEKTGPGEMTDLRSACVNNENFAQVAVKNNLHTHLQRCATVLETQIKEYLMSFSEPDETGRTIPSIQGPKVHDRLNIHA